MIAPALNVRIYLCRDLEGGDVKRAERMQRKVITRVIRESSVEKVWFQFQKQDDA